jgi:pimeloyl-ACP methyl ester carboxylesterase
LAEKYKVVRFDFPGFGGSPQPLEDWGVGDYAKLTAAVLAKLKISSVHAFVGHSFGGRVIIKGYATEVLQADKVILIGAAGIKPKKTIKKAMITGAAKLGKGVTAVPGLRGLREPLRKRLYGYAQSTDYLEAEGMKRIFIKTIEEDLLEAVSSISSPSLLIWGAEDKETPVSDAEKMKARLQNASLVVVPSAGHFVFLDAPEKVNTLVDGFLG